MSCPVISFIESLFGNVSADFLGLPVIPLTFFFGLPLVPLEEKLSTDEAREDRSIESSLILVSTEDSRVLAIFLGTQTSEEMLNGVSGSTRLSILAFSSMS
ncbi:unnamed protein product [Meloidogyne enterolobii]|uniref:Uncharacterized protein n=1 Tax=Meloidogyne enterolobii TaxID=390850 RepID=A0ACB0ZAQ3_MELEN